MQTQLQVILEPDLASTDHGTDLRNLLVTRLCERVGQGGDVAPLRIQLCLDAGLDDEEYSISRPQPDAVHVRGGSRLGLIYGIGKFLRTSTFSAASFQPSRWTGTSRPVGLIRGVYFAIHFHNWYQMATENEINRYVEDLALWGVNAVEIVYPFINLDGWDDPEAQPNLDRLRTFIRALKRLGLAAGMKTNPSKGFVQSPPAFRATRLTDQLGRRGNYGFNICTSIPEAREMVLENNRVLFAGIADLGLDLMTFWPYDEGGCACARCAPWGANGFLSMSRSLADLARSFFPQLKVTLSTWMFDTPDEGEWEGLSRALARDPGWVDYIIADSHGDFPQYPLTNGVPGDLPLISFPEISMWGQYPWGQFGATPLPQRFQRLWHQVKHIVSGGFPYSEGIYEDLNKVIVNQLYWDPQADVEEITREYIGYEISGACVGDTVELIRLIERTHTQIATHDKAQMADIGAAWEIAQSCHARLSDAERSRWRWKLLYYRALLDHERFRLAGAGPWEQLWTTSYSGERYQSWEDVLRSSPLAQEALADLVSLYHAKETDDERDPYHFRVRPPLPARRS
jgi:hypothetical protein